MSYDPKVQRELTELSKQYFNGKSHEDSALEIADLQRLLTYHEWRYYVQNDPVISDYEYDMLYKKLESLEQRYPEYITPDSPTQRVSNDLSSDFATVPHLVPMLSLDNSYNAEDLLDFDQQIRKLTNLSDDEPIEYVVEPKFDGGSIALVYKDDQLVRAATRGNGTAGEEITANARVIHSIPLKANFNHVGIKQVELRGEVLIRKDKFKDINDERAKDGQTLFANPRNTATGGLRMKDPKEVARRGLEAFIYQLGFAANEEGINQLPKLKTHYVGIELLDSLGFKVPKKETKLCRTINEVINFCAFWEEKRETYPYEIDGMVVKVNDLRLQERCGYTSHHPRWAIAYKFKAKQATSKLVNVEYQIGKIGSVTPVAKIEPVQLAGVKVSSISLHNEEFIQSKDIRIGDTVLVERAGDVIPYIVKSMTDMRDGSEQVIQFPSTCPSCKTELKKATGEAAWRCVNYFCKAQVLQRMIHHVSKDAMDIDGFGKSIVERFYELGWLDSLADIYRLDYDRVARLEGFGKKSAANLEKAIEKAKKNPLHRFLYSLSIHHLGKKVSKILAQHVSHAKELASWSLEDFTNIKDVGPVVAENIIAFFANVKNLELLDELEFLGINLSQLEEDQPTQVSADAPLAGKTILFTGALSQMGRKEAQAKAEAAGAKNISAVSGNLNILVAGEKAGSKLKKAQAIGTVQILTEQEFIDLING